LTLVLQHSLLVERGPALHLGVAAVDHPKIAPRSAPESSAPWPTGWPPFEMEYNSRPASSPVKPREMISTSKTHPNSMGTRMVIFGVPSRSVDIIKKTVL
jgi:hypothetical protein